MPEIHIDNLGKVFGDLRVLDDVTFHVEEGELFTLLGPSGCGKSTTLMSIAGFQTPDEGTVRVGDETFFDAGRRTNVAAEARNLGIVFQSYAVWPHMTVFDNLAFPLKVRKVKKREIEKRVIETLELVEMREQKARYPHQLSGGQQQRVALARSLVYSPSILLLDEPFSNLDAKLRERARSWVKDLQQTLGLTTIFVTHDQDEALSMSDRVLVMSAGKVLQIGTPEEIYRRPTNRFVAEFVGQCNLITGDVASANGGSAVIDVHGTPHRLTLRTDRPLAVASTVTVAVRPEAVALVPADSPAINGTNAYDASVTTAAFLGDHYQYEVQAGPLALTVQRAVAVAGDRLKVHIPPDACSVVE
jgi:iron(III) transport system ATP-binding protein